MGMGMGSTSAAGDFTVDELDVAGVLINFPNLIKKSKSFLHCPSLWCVKRKRSAIDVPNSKLDVASTIPTSPIDSDSKPLPPVPKKNKAQLLKECLRLTDLRDQLQRDIKKVEASRNELMEENRILRERRQQASVVVLPLTQSHIQRQPVMVLEYRYRRAWVAMAETKAAAAALARRNRSLIQKAKNSNRLPRGSRR